MSEPKSERIIIPMSQKMVADIDDYRFNKRLNSRADAIRELIQKGLDDAVIHNANIALDNGKSL